jgi:RNA polymerase sigma factor FliA
MSTLITTTEQATVAAHLNLVRYLVARTPRHVDRDGLLSAGNLALLLGVRSYDPDRGVPLPAWLAMCIRHGLGDELRRDDWLGRESRRNVTALRTATTRLAASLGREPSVAELAADTGHSAARVRGWQADAAGRPTALTEAALRCVGAGPDPGAVLAAREQVGLLHEAVDALPTQMRTVVTGCDFAGRSRAALGVELGVTASRISHIHTKALGWLRDGMSHRDDTRTAGQPGGAAYLARCAVPHSLASRLAWTDIHGDVLPVPRMRLAD